MSTAWPGYETKAEGPWGRTSVTEGLVLKGEDFCRVPTDFAKKKKKKFMNIFSMTITPFDCLSALILHWAHLFEMVEKCRHLNRRLIC